MLSWEYPPQMVGGLGQHVYELSRHLVALGVTVHIITPSVPDVPNYEEVNGIYIHRVGKTYTPDMSFKGWVMSFNSYMVRQGIGICRDLNSLKVIHAHDWLVAYGARTLSKMFDLSMVATIHATEWGRNGGLFNRTQVEINDIERNLSLEASRVICCSNYMREEVMRLFGIDKGKTAVIPNGIEVSLKAPRPVKERKNVIFFIGRLVPEKGAQVLVKAMPKVLEKVPDARLVIGGKGPCYEDLYREARELKIDDKVSLLGYIDEETKARLYQEAAVAVFPSLYEPFGIVALEAMAAGAPLVVSGVGGLDEIVKDGMNGRKVSPNDHEALAEAIAALLIDRNMAERMARYAYQEVSSSYSWKTIAAATREEYLRATTGTRQVIKEVI